MMHIIGKLLRLREGGVRVAKEEAPWGQVVIGDNTSVLRKLFPSESVDLVVTSPPYDKLRDYSGEGWEFKPLARELTRVLMPGGVIVWVVADATVGGGETLTSLRQALYFVDECGLRMHDTMIWKKTNPLPQSHNRYEPCWEYMFVLSKGKPKSWNPITQKTLNGGKTMEWGKRRALEKKASRRGRKDSDVRTTNHTKPLFNVWETPVGGEVRNHPAVFPLKLAENHVSSWSNEGDAVLDPFSGSGTTCLAAKNLGRRWAGIEISEDYVKNSLLRIHG